MKSRRTAISLGLVVSIGITICAGADETEDARAFFKQALKAHEQKDYASFVENMEAALRLRPNHQIYMYDLAAAYSLAGRTEQAIVMLSRAAAMGFVFPEIDNDTDFSSLHGNSDFDAARKKFVSNLSPIGHSKTAFTVHEKGLVPEGLAYDSETKTFFLGSVYRRKIVAVNKAGDVRDFSRQSDGLWSVMGMKVDAKRHLLWGCTAGHMQMANAKPEEDGKTAVFKYELANGKLLKKYAVPGEGRKHWLGDLVLDSHGNVYASDSVSPAIYVIRPDKDEIELLVASANFVNPQGIILTPDEKKLLMADYLKGLFLIDLQTRQVQEIAAPPNASLLGFDGLYRKGHDVVAVQNGITPNRVVRLKMSDDNTKVEKVEVLEANNPVFDEPTLGVINGDEFYFIANSQWGTIDAKGTLAPPEKLRDPIVLRLNL